jgi:4'-phosphopantetheinyl transferase
MATPGAHARTSASRQAGTADRAAEVWWFDIREVTLGPADLADLDPRETARATAFVFPADRHRYQVAHVMLRRVLAGRLGSEPGRLAFARQRCPACGGPSGKPVLASLPPGKSAGSGLSFSLAHSGDTVAIAVARGPVGIDVERAATGCVCSLAPAMHPEDTALAEALPESERHAAIIRWWVRMEAVLKYTGTGIAHGMDAFPVLRAECCFADLTAPKGYQAALALPELTGSLAAGSEVGDDGGLCGGRVPDTGGQDQGDARHDPPRSPVRWRDRGAAGP